jgi:Tol biopolymer transport system component
MTKQLTQIVAAALVVSSALPLTGQVLDRIAFVSNRDGNSEVYVMAPDGSGQTNLTNFPSTDQSPAWSPDAQRIVFASDREGSFDLFVMDADGINVVRLTSDAGVEADPAWSPDGRTILFASDRGATYSIFGMDAEGGEPYRLTGDEGHDIGPAWSPSGEAIAFSSSRRPESTVRPFLTVLGLSLEGSGTNALSDIYVMDPTGTDLVNLTAEAVESLAGDAGTFSANWPAWAPDGSRLMFKVIYEKGNVFGARLSLLDLSGRIANHQFNGSYTSPSWSPDGGRVTGAQPARGRL